MAAVSHSDSKRMYSWWWDSHISPKNSKWLQENLTDMDSKVKQMIKLIEEDADSFARRAEMYYKKRPELMKLVEEFYRAYRALAERYDHATGVIRQAHRTMAEAFPNQVPPVPPDDAPPPAVTEPRTPAFLDSHELQKYASGTSPSHDVSVSGEDVDHEKFAQGRARKGLNFIDPEENNNGRHSHDSGTQQIMFDCDRVTKTEMEILALKKALAKLEGEKEAGLLHYQQSMERLSNLESEVSHTQESSRGLDERASKAEAEVLTLKEELIKLQAQREVSLIQYQQCLERIFNLEDKISSVLKDAGEYNERATKAETEASSLKQDLARVEAEKEAALVQHKQCLETLQNLEGRLLHAEEKARKINEQAKNTENELEAMKLEIARLTEEKEDAALHYQKCLDVISSLEHKLSCAEEEMRRLKCYVDDKTEKLQSSEQKCFFLETSNQTLHSELQSLMQKMGSQSEEINEKQKELGKLWTCVQEERLRFMEAETAFQTLQHLQTQSQEELRSLTAELHNKAEILKNVESCKLTLQDEVRRVMDENQALNEHKWSSSSSIKNLQDEILNLRKTIAKLEQEVELRVEERNSLQQGIYCLKEELNDVSRRHKAIMEEVSSTGIDPQCFVSSVRKLQDENSKLKETREADRSEKAVLLEKLEIMDKLMEKNAYLENSLSDLNIELQNVRGKVKLLEETCHSLLTEKSTLVAEKDALFSQLQTTLEKLEKLSEKNKLLENSLFDVNAELEGLRVKTKILEDSCHLLDQENSSLISGKETLVSQFNSSHQKLKNLEKRCSELEMEQLELKGEKEFALHKVEELLVSLYTEREEHYRIVKLNKSHLAEKELQIQILQEDANCQKKEYEDELDRALKAQIEIFILQNCIQELEKKNSSLLNERQRIFEASKISEELISQFKYQHVHVQKQVDMNSLYEITRKLSIELLQAVKTLDLSNDHFGGEVIEENLVFLNHIHDKLKEAHNSFATQHFNESQQLAIENLVLVESLGQLRLTVEKLVTERGAQDKELRNQSEQFLALKAEVHKIMGKNQEHIVTISKGEERMEAMAAEIENLHKQLSDADKAYSNLQEESCKTLEEKKSLMRRISDLDDEKSNLEEEIHVIICETIAQSSISVIFKNIVIEKIQALKEIGEGLDQLRLVQNDLRKQIEQWETLAATLYAELQISTVYETLFEGKVWELADTCEGLENGWNSRVMESERMKERISKLEHENGRLRGQLAAYVPVFNGLDKCIASLELQIHVLAKSHDNEEPKVNNMVTQQYGKGDPHTGAGAGAVDAIPDLQDMQKRIHAIEMSVKQMNASFKGKDKVKEIQALKSVSGRYQENIQWNKHITIMDAAKDGVIDEHEIWKSMPDIPVAENEVLPKDIMLDQMSECSSYGLSRRETLEVDDQMLELWETTNKDSNSIGLTVGKTQKTASRPSNYHQRRTRKESKLKCTSTESLIEKELSVDKLEISSSRRIRVPREEGNKRKVIEKLDSDAQKLTNLHIVVQDLTKKVDITRQRPMGKDIEYDTVKRQLEAAEESITKLFEANRKVVKNVEDGDRRREIAESDESSGSVSRRRAYEQARRGSEKIGRLQLEVQRLQFLLLKLDDEIESRAKTRIADRNPRVLLRDYLYGGTRSRTIHKKKKAPFCGCVQPPTKA